MWWWRWWWWNQRRREEEEEEKKKKREGKRNFSSYTIPSCALFTGNVGRGGKGYSSLSYVCTLFFFCARRTRLTLVFQFFPFSSRFLSFFLLFLLAFLANERRKDLYYWHLLWTSLSSMFRLFCKRSKWIQSLLIDLVKTNTHRHLQWRRKRKRRRRRKGDIDIHTYDIYRERTIHLFFN